MLPLNFSIYQLRPVALTCIWNTGREWSCKFAVHSISEQNNLMVYSQADARPCLLCTQKFKIKLESPWKAKGIAFPLKAEQHWFDVFLCPLLQPLQGHRALHECYKWIKKYIFLWALPTYQHESLCCSTLELVCDFNHAGGLNFHRWNFETFPLFVWFVIWISVVTFYDHAVFHISLQPDSIEAVTVTSDILLAGVVGWCVHI